MTSMDQEHWARVKDRLKAEVGEAVYSSWFARIDLEGIDGDSVENVSADALSQKLDSVSLR